MVNTATPSPDGSTDPTRTLSVYALSALVAQATNDLRYVTTLVEDLQTWTNSLPRTHVPHGEATLVQDFLPQEEVDDPNALQEQLHQVSEQLGQLADVGRKLRAIAERDAVVFEFPKLVRA